MMRIQLPGMTRLYLVKPPINNKNIQGEAIKGGESMGFLNVQADLRQ